MAINLLRLCGSGWGSYIRSKVFLTKKRQIGVRGWALAALTAALFCAALVNLSDRSSYELADDGAHWVDGDGAVEAWWVDPSGPAAQAGVREGDRVISINGRRIAEAIDVPRVLAGQSVWTSAEYAFERDGVEFKHSLVIRAAARGGVSGAFQWIVGLFYLVVGAFVLYRGHERPMARHFYLFCLASFVLYCFRFSEQLDGFNRFIYWSDVWATLLAPALFLHFCLAFPGGRLTARRKSLAFAAYTVAGLTGAAYQLGAAGVLSIEGSALGLPQLLDRFSYALLGGELLLGALTLQLSRRRQEDLAVRQQRRWLAHGTLWGALPFCGFYVLPYVLGGVPGPNHSISVFSLALIPIAFAFAIAKHKLMDVDLYFRRGTAYTFATALVLALFYGGVFVLSGWIEPQLGGLGPASWVTSVVVVALLFHPLRSWIQRVVDRRYYRERYDYRQTLADFSAELSTETDPDQMLNAVSERLKKTLALERIAVFVAEESHRFELVKSLGFDSTAEDLSFLANAEPGWKGLYFEDPSRNRERTETVRRTVAGLDLNYYVPCSVRGRTIAYFGLGRTHDDNYLSSEDLALVRAVSGNFAIALENARLYRSLAQKAQEYERLKDYNENIVESLHVGILAVDLEDRVESWNTQLELVFGISRQQAVGRKLNELLPEALVETCHEVRKETGVHNIYKFALRACEFPERFRPVEGSPDSNSERTINIAIAPLIAKNFDPIGRLIILDDVTDRTELEEQLVQADKLSSIGLLAAGVAHEVNTPLAVISSYAQMLANQAQGAATNEKILKRITEQTFRASEIVNSLLSFSRTSSSELASLDLNAAVEDTVALVEPQIRKAGIRIEKRFEAALPEVHGVANKLQQVLLNLLINARDAMPDGGSLTVETLVENDVACIHVSDTGVGIDRDQLGRIFDPFYTTKGPKRGTGLGLAVSYGIVREHGGQLRVDSAPGEGSRFTIELPLVKQPVHA